MSKRQRNEEARQRESRCLATSLMDDDGFEELPLRCDLNWPHPKDTHHDKQLKVVWDKPWTRLHQESARLFLGRITRG